MKFGRNPDSKEELEQATRVGNIDALRSYITLLVQNNELLPEEFQDILGMTERLIQLNPNLVFSYLELDQMQRKYAKIIFDQDANLGVSYISDPNTEMRPQSWKFNSVLDQLLHQSGNEEEQHSNQLWENYAEIYLLKSESLDWINRRSIELTKKPLTAAEMELIISSIGAILTESTQGLVRVTYFDKAQKEELNDAWEETKRRIWNHTHDEPTPEETEETSCRECGNPVYHEGNNIWLHETDEEQNGHDLDADHVAIPDVSEERRSNPSSEIDLALDDLRLDLENIEKWKYVYELAKARDMWLDIHLRIRSFRIIGIDLQRLALKVKYLPPTESLELHSAWCLDNNCDQLECHRCFPRWECREHSKCHRELTKKPSLITMWPTTIGCVDNIEHLSNYISSIVLSPKIGNMGEGEDQ